MLELVELIKIYVGVVIIVFILNFDKLCSISALLLAV